MVYTLHYPDEVITLTRDQLAELIKSAIETAQQAGDLPPFDLPEVVVERPKEPAHGDYATPIAMGLARLSRMDPLQIATKIVNHLPPAAYLGEVVVAPPGFINLRLAESWLAQQVETILAEGSSF